MFVALFRFQLFRAECSQFVDRMDVIVLSRRLPELFTKCHVNFYDTHVFNCNENATVVDFHGARKLYCLLCLLCMN